VLSTCRAAGGLREDLELLYNHQSCEPRKHLNTDLCEVAVKSPQAYRARICEKAGINPEKASGMGTAANMNNAAIAEESHEGLEVLAITTAGVGGNGGRAGDPASYYQTEQGTCMVGKPVPPAGTINSLLFINQELTPGAMVVAATLMAEAKASLLQELGAASRYSGGIATGTGTDQVIIASQLGTKIVHTDSNKHSKLGELIGKAVRRSLQEALILQSGMSPKFRCSVIAQLQRFGELQERFISAVRSQLSEEDGELFENNFLSANHDPVTVSAVLACCHIMDQVKWGVLPETCLPDMLVPLLVQVTRAVSGKQIDPEQFIEAVETRGLGIQSDHFTQLIHTAYALGYSKKWADRFPR